MCLQTPPDPDNSTTIVHHPLVQMVLFARNKFADTFACCKSMAPKSIFDMAKRLHAPALSNWGKTIWNSAKPKAESPKVGTFSDFSTGESIVRRNELTENESHPSDTDASGAAWVAATAAPHHATGNRALLSGFIIEHDDQFVHGVDEVPRKVLARDAVITDSVVLPDVWFVPGLTENLVSVSQLVELDHSRDDRLQVPMAHEGTCIYYIILDKMPTAAGSVKCGDADESSMLAKQTSPQQQFVLNSSGDGGSGDPHPNSALRVTPFVETAFTPMVPELTEVDPQHPRKIGLASEDDILKADYIFIHMMVGSHGISADRSMQYSIILDSGAAYHCTGDRSQLSDYCDGVAPVAYLRGAGGTLMRVHGTGSIHNENFQVKGVLYVPGLNNQPNINKTIFSVSKLNELGFSVLFNCDGTSSVMNLEHEIVGKARHVRGLFMMDYLRIPDNRAPVAMLVGRGPGLVKSLWNASLSVWTSITGRLSQRTTYAQRPPV